MNLIQKNSVQSDRKRLIALSRDLLEEIQDMTEGTDAENWLNKKYGVGTPVFENISAMVKAGVIDGWAANIEIGGPMYRRSRIAELCRETLNFSITAVYMNSAGNVQNNPENSLRGNYHAHPHGEFNMVIPLDERAALAGPNGWCHGGWTAPPPASHHYPEAKGGAVIALFFLPAGRISYKVMPPISQKYLRCIA
jgi:hypothetical protein